VQTLKHHHIVGFCPNLARQRLDLEAETGMTNIRWLLSDKEKARKTAKWPVQTGLFTQFNVTREIEEEDMENWAPFTALS
jgi:hypothetical protein